MSKENNFYVKQIKHNLSNKIDRYPRQVGLTEREQ